MQKVGHNFKSPFVKIRLLVRSNTLDKKCLQLFQTYVEKNKGNDSRAFHYMFQYLYLDTNEHGYLDWKLRSAAKATGI